MANQDSASIYDNPDKILKASAASMVVLNNYERSRDQLIDKMRDKWQEWYRAYRAYVEIRDDDITSNLVIALIFAQIEAYIPRFVANRPRIEVWPRGPEDRLRAAQHRAKLDYDWDHMRMDVKGVNLLKSSMIYGTGWYKGYHKKETKVRIVREQALIPSIGGMFGFGMPQLGLREVEKPVVVWDDPQVDVLLPDEVFPDPDGYDEDTCAYIIHRYPVTLHHLETATKNGQPLYKQEVVSKLKKRAEMGNPENSPQFDANSLREDRESMFGPEGSRQVDPHKRRYHMLEQWSDDKVVCVIEEEPDLDPVRNDRNPYGIKPFARYTPIPDPNSLLGISLSEVLFANQLETSTLHNARMDHVLQSVHNMMTIRRGSNINPQNIRFRPGGYTFVDEHDDINWMQPPRMDFALYREEDNNRLWSQQIGGATEPFMGMKAKQGGGTATEAALASQASGSRAGLMYQMYGMQCLNRLGRILMRINESEMLNEKHLPSISGEFQTIQPAVLNGGTNLDLEVRIDVAETEPETKLFRRKENIEALQTVGALYGPGHPLTQKFMVNVAETYDIQNAEQLAAIPPQPPPEQQAPAGGGPEGVAQQIAAQMGAGGAPGAGDGRLMGVS